MGVTASLVTLPFWSVVKLSGAYVNFFSLKASYLYLSNHNSYDNIVLGRRLLRHPSQILHRHHRSFQSAYMLLLVLTFRRILCLLVESMR